MADRISEILDEYFVHPEFTMASDEDGGSVVQPRPATENAYYTESLDNLGTNMQLYNNEGFVSAPPHTYSSSALNGQSWVTPATMSNVPPNNTMMYDTPPLDPTSLMSSTESLKEQLANLFPGTDLQFLANTLYEFGYAPEGMPINDQPTSSPYPDLSSPSAFTSPSETSIADANVYSDVEPSNEGSSSGSSAPSPSCSLSPPTSDTRLFASTRASDSNGAVRLHQEIANTSRPPMQLNSASCGNKRKIDVSELEDLALCDDDHEDSDIESSDEDEYRPESGEDDSEGDARSRGLFILSKWPPPGVPNDDIQPVANPNRGKKRSSSKPRGPAARKVFVNDGDTKAVGGFVCGLITQWKGKGGQYTAKGIPTPEVGEVCQMRTRNWSDMIRHQEKTFWHSPPGVCQSCQSSLNGRQDNLHRHGQAACKGPTKGKKVSSKKPSKKARK